MAYLAGGQGRTINAAVASLVNAKALMMVADAPPRFRQREPLPPESHELERFAYASFSRSEKGDVSARGTSRCGQGTRADVARNYASWD